MLLPQEVAEKLTSDERMDLAAEVASRWNEEFGVESVTRKGNRVTVVVVLKNGTHQEVRL